MVEEKSSTPTKKELLLWYATAPFLAVYYRVKNYLKKIKARNKRIDRDIDRMAKNYEGATYSIMGATWQPFPKRSKHARSK